MMNVNITGIPPNLVENMPKGGILPGSIRFIRIEGDTASYEYVPPQSKTPTYKPVPGSEYFGEISRCWFATDSGDGEVIRAEPTREQSDSPDVWPLTEDTVWGPE
jgi:hypothetical protein